MLLAFQSSFLPIVIADAANQVLPIIRYIIVWIRPKDIFRFLTVTFFNIHQIILIYHVRSLIQLIHFLNNELILVLTALGF